MTSGLDLSYLKSHPDNIVRLIEHQRIRSTPVGGGTARRMQRLTLDDGTDVFARFEEPGSAVGFLAAEAAGLRWLAQTGTVRVPEVLVITDQLLVTSWIEAGPASAVAAEKLARELAALHNCAALSYGATWSGRIGSLLVGNDPADTWLDFYASRRLLPALRAAANSGKVTAKDVQAVEKVLSHLGQLLGPEESPVVIHGNLDSGTAMFGMNDQVWLVDPTAYGGHREVDLAALVTADLPNADRFLASYTEMSPLRAGWEDRLPVYSLPALLAGAAAGIDPGSRIMDIARRCHG
jgi:fructosamine-3-kinase